jgi:hypothetical protein
MRILTDAESLARASTDRAGSFGKARIAARVTFPAAASF